MKKLAKALNELIEKIKFYIKLKRMDDWWYYTGGNCFGMFPPSFYYTHTEEEIKRITDEALEELQALIEELADQEKEKTPYE